MKTIKIITLALLSAGLIAANSNASVYYSRANGNWSDASTWSVDGCGGIPAIAFPAFSDSVIICSGYSVTINTASECFGININGGSLLCNASLLIGGNFLNNGTFNAGTQSVTFNGAQMQIIRGTSAITFYDLTINNSTPAEAVRLNSPVTVNNNFKLKDGHITTTAVNILTCGASGTISLVATPQDSSFVKGPMKHTVNVSTGVTKIYPVGKNDSYRRIDLTIDQKTAAFTTYAVDMINSSAAALNYSLPPTISNVSYVRYHEVLQSPSSTKLDMAQARIYFSCSGVDDQVVSLIPISVAKDNGTGSWIDLLDTPNGFSCGDTYWGSLISGTFTSFQGSKFTLTNTGPPAPLAVSLTGFNANANENTVDLFWTTASEKNSDYFAVERSKDGKQFEEIGQVIAAGNSSEKISYSFQDNFPYQGVSYYRLKQLDKNGTFEYSKTVSATLTNTDAVSVFPNPASEYLNVAVSGKNNSSCTISIHDLIGREIYSEKVILSSDKGVVTINLKNNFSPGAYFVSVSEQNSTYVKKIIIN